MEKIRFFITAIQDDQFPRYFPKTILDQLEKWGTVKVNPYGRPMTRDELAEVLKETDILITHWQCPQIDETMLKEALQLKMVAHAAGTVAQIACEGVFDREIPVLSANPIMARSVAEGCIGYLLAGLRQIPQQDQQMKQGLWIKKKQITRPLMGTTIGMIGLGTVARELLDLLSVFHVQVKVYDPYMKEGDLNQWPFASRSSLEEAMSQVIVSVHASKTPETYHMINKETLAMMPDGALLLNSSRGSLVDTEALIDELQTGRIYAVLDVYEEEGIPQPEGLIHCTENTVLQPHMLAAPISWQMTQAIVDDIGRFLKGEPLKYTVTRNQFRMMTQETLK